MAAPPPPGSAAWIDAMLRERLGPGASAGTISFDGRLLRVEGARVPLGTRWIAIERAEIELGAGLPLGALPLAARLVSLRGSAGGATFELAATGAGASSWFHGTARFGELTVELDVAPVGVTVTSAGTRLTLALAGGGLDGARLSGRLALADVLALGFGWPDLGPRTDGVIDLDLGLHGTLAEPSARGRVFAASLVLVRRSRPDARGVRIDDLSLAVDVDRRRLRYRDLRADAHGARIGGWGRIPLAPPGTDAEGVPLAAVSLEHAGVALVTALASLFGGEVRVAPDLALAGELMLKPDRSATGALTAETPRSRLALRLVIAPDGGLVGSTLRGRLAAADAVAAGLFPGPVRPRPPAVLDVDARLGGSLARPGLTGRLASAEMILDVSRDPSHPSLLLQDVSVLLDVDGARLAWRRFEGGLYGGTFSSSGHVGIGDAAALRATLGVRDVRVERLPTQSSGESRLAALLHGAASGDVHVRRHGVAGAPVTARGELTVAEPVYLFTRGFAAELRRRGLPPVGPRGAGPLTVRGAFRGGALVVESLAAAASGVELGGDLHVGERGDLRGRLAVRLLDAYLAESALLAIPAVFAGRITIPVEVAGTVRAPEVRADARAALAGLLGQSRLGEAVKGVIDGLYAALRGPQSRRR